MKLWLSQAIGDFIKLAGLTCDILLLETRQERQVFWEEWGKANNTSLYYSEMPAYTIWKVTPIIGSNHLNDRKLSNKPIKNQRNNLTVTYMACVTVTGPHYNGMFVFIVLGRVYLSLADVNDIPNDT